MELFSYELTSALQEITTTTVIKWGGSKKALPIVLPWLWLQGCWQLLKGGVSVIHAQDGVMAPPIWLLARLSRKPYTVVLHGLDITYPNRLFQKVIPWFVRRADMVFCISTATAEEAKARGVPAEKVHIIPLAVNDVLHGTSDRKTLLRLLDLPPDTETLLTVGRLVKRKGVAWFIKNVLPSLVTTHPKLVYLVVGEGGMRTEIEAVIQTSAMQDHVRILGRIHDELYKATYNGADVFVMPNIKVVGDMEGFGLVLLEASLCERPIVAADLEGIADAVVDGKNAVLIKTEDAAAFEREVGRFLDNPKAARAFGSQSRAFTLDHYQWSKIARTYLSYFEAVAKKR